MLGMMHRHRRPVRDEAEKPFWISFSDMMTALMVLFLVVMTVTPWRSPTRSPRRSA
jgi:hypothetical protein